jgi:hypothetical protein
MCACKAIYVILHSLLLYARKALPEQHPLVITGGTRVVLGLLFTFPLVLYYHH